MGERIGYCVRKDNQFSGIFRKQWMINPREVIKNTWNTLLSTSKYNLKTGEIKRVKGKVDDGNVAIRDDLDIGRAFAALVYSNYLPPFDSIEQNTSCDIADHGLIIIDISNYKNWNVYSQEVGFYDNELGEIKLIGTMTEKGFKSKKEITV